MTSLLHIAPQLPPAIDGVGDYCWNLWKHWPEPEPQWSFLVARGADDTAATWREVNVSAFELGNASLVAALEQSSCETVVLHYVGYGFQPKGIPIWLPGALAQWKKSNPERRLITMFHEMFASSSPLRSPFWVAPFARNIIRQLIRLSDAWMTSCDRYFKQLTTELGARAELGRIIPIGSNIPLVASLRSKWTGPVVPPARFRVVVFGLARTRIWALERHWMLLRVLREAGVLESITLLGKHNGPGDEAVVHRFVESISEVAWHRRFDLTAAELSRELVECDAGVLANEPDILTKSGVFAAFATHGVIPVVSTLNGAALPAFASQAVLSNDETPQIIASVLDALRDTAGLRSRRKRLLTIAADRIAWPGIAQQWQGIVKDISPRRSSQRANVAVPILTSV